MRNTFIFTILLFFIGLTDSFGLNNKTNFIGSGSPLLLVASDESFESGFGGWTQSSSDDMDWTRKTGGTSSGSTGPSGAYNGSYYIYTEASSPNYPSKLAVITSPTYDFSTLSAFSFNYNMYGATIGSIQLQISTNGGASWGTIWTKSGNQGTIWQAQTVDLSAYTGNGMLRFSATTGTNYTGDIALDNFVFTSGSVSCNYAFSLDNNENYVFTRIFQEPMTSSSEINDVSDVIEQVTYIDGLGRTKQQVGIRQSNSPCKDLVTHIEYDPYGRQTKGYLPVPKSGTPGSYYSNDLDLDARNYYNSNFPEDFNGVSTANPYSDSQLEASPLSRPEKQAAPGYDWRLGGGNEIEMDYQTNTISEVRYYNVTFNNGNTEAPLLNGGGSYYTAGELYKTVTKDENHSSGTAHTTEEFKDKQGRVILKRTYADSDNNGDGDTIDPGESNAKHDTYYVYDDYGNLTFVLPPKVIHDSSISTTEKNELCYQYKYDHRNRLIEKKIPGKGWEFIVYNTLDQPVMHTDSNLKSLNRWLFTKYDAFGRVAYTGYTNKSVTISRSSLQNTVNASDSYVARTSNSNTYAGTPVYYSNAAEPVSMNEIYTINYYDSYDNLNIGFTIPNSNTFSKTIKKGISTRGLATLIKTKVLETSQWITTAMGYDDKGRVIWTKTNNPFLGTTDIVEHDLDFTGSVKQTKTTHQKSGKADIVTIDTFEYDHVKRLIKHSQSINGGAQELIAENTYDELGQLKSKDVGNTSGNALQTVDYAYNVRGWLKEINDVGNIADDLFTFEISYNNPELSGSVGLYNGNISETIWQTANDKNAGTPVTSRAYQFEYDALNRLIDADYYKDGSHLSSHGKYEMIGVYDKNGNITKLSRGTGYGTIDGLQYTYSYNQLMEVVDLGYSGSRAEGFVDDGVAGNDYSYDSNGNMTSDLNKGIQTNGITYNHLNLPTSVTLPGGTISYIYDATGVKQRKVAAGTTTDYAGNYLYQGGTLQFFNHPEGYVGYDGGNFNYVYNYKDHLGNIRLSYTDINQNNTNSISLKIAEENNYYPFGLRHKGYNDDGNGYGNSAAKKYKFGGKELQEEHGLDWYDVSARNYDPALGRWMNVDPLAERGPQYSPYSFSFNNPILFVDPDGRWPYPVTFRSFHPNKSFGKGRWFVPIGAGRNFSGDNRSFSLANGASSRITHSVTADPQKGTLSYLGRNGGTFSDDSHHPYFGTDRDTPDGYVGRIKTEDNSISFETGYNGTNPLAYGPTPDIDVDARLSLVQDGDILNITGQVAGDNFPNTEGYITDPSGQKLFIGTDVRASGEDQNPTILFGPATEQIMDINMQVRTNPANGNFIEVMQNGSWVKPDDWNKPYLNQSPNPQN